MADRKTKQEIEELKAQWKADPCWDIEDTEGFEAHYDELLHFHNEMDEFWAQQRFDEIVNRATELKCSLEVATYIIGLEARLKGMETRLDELWGKHLSSEYTNRW